VIFALPLYDDNPIRRTPVVTYVLIGMCIGAFLWQLGQDEEAVSYQFGMIPAALFGYAHLPPGLQIVPPWATILTSMFLHGGFLHLGGNMLFLWIFGNNIEDLLGRARYLLLYLGSGVAAALAQALSDKLSDIPMVGASGAIAGVLGAYLICFPRARVTTLIPLFIFITVREIPAIVILGFWFVFQLFVGVASIGVSEQNAGGVAYFAHIGGFAFGMVLVALMGGVKRRRMPPARWQ
jgi:membrane associated rhomboid family serine protease